MQNRTKSKQLKFSKKKEKTKSSDLLDLASTADIELEKFCPLKLFNVLFINEVDEYSTEVVNKLIETSKQFKDISNLTFITYEDVMSLMENCDSVNLPNFPKVMLVEITKIFKQMLEETSVVPPNILAKLMKLKLVEVMYKSYINEVNKMQQRRKLREDLKILTDACLSPTKREPFKKPTSKINSNVTKTASSATKFQVGDDYTMIPIETDDDIVFDDDIHHHVAYYVFKGFYDVNLIRELIANNVKVLAVLKFSAFPDEDIVEKLPGVYSDYWDQIYKQFDGPERRSFLENTMLLTYTSSGDNFKEILEELLYVIRSTSEIKLYHLNYIRHMNVYQPKETYNYYPLECLTMYNNLLKKYPFELVNVPLLCDALLKQVCTCVDQSFTISGHSSEHSSYLGINLFGENRCINPCSIQAFFKHKLRNPIELPTPKQLNTSFVAHENDKLGLVLNSYKKYVELIYDTTLKMLKHSKSLKDLKYYEEDLTDIIHKHDIDPSTKTVIKHNDTILHLLYLFLFTFFENKNIFPKLVDTDLTKNFETYQKLDFFNLCQTKIKDSDSSTAYEDKFPTDNLYDVAAVEYFWKEHLNEPTLCQEVCKAEEEYLYCDKKYSPETDTLLIQFTDYLDEFGVSTKIYDTPLLTPVCLRDFCKYTVTEQSEWLETNKPPKYVRKCTVKEACLGAKKALNINLYTDYHHLIETAPLKESNANENLGSDTQIEEITFEKLVEELKDYPSNDSITNECLKSDKPGQFLVYDIGTKYFQVRGAKTVFHSHDDVKLVIDNTRMIDEYPKCSVTVECEDNSLTVHSNQFYAKETYDIHMTLADGTIISFIFWKRRKIERAIIPPEAAPSAAPSVAPSAAPSAAPAEEQVKKPVKPYKSKIDMPKYSVAENIQENKVLCVDQNYFDNVVETKLLNEEYSSPKELPFGSPEKMLESLKLALMNSTPIYKVNNNLKYIKKLNSTVAIPLSHIVKRVMHNFINRTETEPYTKRFLPTDESKNEPQMRGTFDARIALPNGLYVSFYPSKLKKDFMEVKQEYVCHNPSTEEEEFRLFSREGQIFIKKIDGTITVFKSNGDIVNHEKLDAFFENLHKINLKPCHCKNIEDYKKRVSKIMSKKRDDPMEYSISRKMKYVTRKGYITNPDTLKILGNAKLPYLKTAVLKFDGSYVCVESNKVTVKKSLYTTQENKYIQQELWYERSDGLKSILDKNGRQSVEFVDGTKIVTTPYVSLDLVDDFVYISLEYEYQHPNYASVSYCDEDLKISLNNNVVFQHNFETKTVLNIDDKIFTRVNREEVVFEKCCPKCTSKYTCHININPLVSGKLKYSDNFVHAYDSYEKHFYSDFMGNCERNDNYIRGLCNVLNCNHYNKMNYKKLFVVNRNMSGDKFWTESMVVTKKKATNEDRDCVFSEYKDNKNIQVYKFKKMFYDHYSNRYLNKLVYTHDSPKDLVYSTFCVLRRMVTPKSLEKFLQNLMNYLLNVKDVDTKFVDILIKMASEKKRSSQRDNQEIVRVNSVLVQTDQCKCIKEKIGIPEKIKKWREEYKKYSTIIRNNVIPCYFDSPFCQITKTK